jgi:hypothetical protein
MNSSVNPDLAKERHGNLDMNSLKQLLADTRYSQPGEYKEMIRLSKYQSSVFFYLIIFLSNDYLYSKGDDLMTRIKPVYEENFYNLNRDQKYQMILKKSLEICEYSREKNVDLATLIKFPTG